jgi:hypothetical protein
MKALKDKEDTVKLLEALSQRTKFLENEEHNIIDIERNNCIYENSCYTAKNKSNPYPLRTLQNINEYSDQTDGSSQKLVLQRKKTFYYFKAPIGVTGSSTYETKLNYHSFHSFFLLCRRLSDTI